MTIETIGALRVYCRGGVEQERINWWVVGLATMAGLAAMVLGLWLGDWSKESWSAVAIEVGAAIGLVSAIVLLERHVVRRVALVAETTARAEAERVTADLRGRVQSLEDLDVAQRDTHAARRDHDRQRLDSVRSGEVTSSAIGDLLVSAINDRLFAADDFCVRTSGDPACPVLYALPFIDPSEVVGVYFDVEPIRLADRPMIFEGRAIPVPIKRDATVLWMKDDAAAIGAELLAGLERRNEPTHGFGFGYATERLLHSFEVMRSARAAPAGDACRLAGSLKILINDDWAYTTQGLEAISASMIWPVKTAGWEAGTGRRVGAYLVMSRDARAAADTPLGEALTWLESRENLAILEPGDDPTDAIFRRDR